MFVFLFFVFHLWINLQASSKDVVRQLCQESFSTSALGSKKLLDTTCSSLSVTQEEAEQVSVAFGHWILNSLVSFLTSQSLLCPRKCLSWNIYWCSKLNIDFLKMLVKLKTVIFEPSLPVVNVAQMGELYWESELLTISFSDLLPRQCDQKPSFSWFPFPACNLLMLINCQTFQGSLDRSSKAHMSGRMCLWTSPDLS